MKQKFFALIFLSGASFARGQGTFIWDQQITGITDAVGYLTNQPLGQPFTPSQSTMDAAAFYLGGVFGASGDVEVNVRSGSINGEILGTSDAVAYTGTGGAYYFLFASPIALTPGTEYYLQPFELSGSGIQAELCNAQNLSGQAIAGGTTFTSFNFFFQEGIVVPEPCVPALFLVGGGIACWRRRKQRVT